MNARKLLNIAAFGLIITGLILKTNELHGMSEVFILAAITMILSLGMFAVKDNREAGLGNGLNFLLVGILILLIIGTVMKMQHWPGSALILMPAYALLPIALIVLILQNETIKISKQLFISFALFFMFLLIIMPKNPFFLNQFQRGHEVTESCSEKACCKSEKACCSENESHQEH